jgi:hypothetical protein
MLIKLFNLGQTSTLDYEEKFIRDGIITWGKENDYPKYLQSLMDKSSKHNAIMKSKASMIGGGGFTSIDPRTEQFLIENNMDDVLLKISYDYELYGNFALNIIWSRDRQSISKINYIDVSKVRVMTPELGLPVSKFAVSDDWTRTRMFKPVIYDAFNTSDKINASQILWVKDFRPGSEFYSLPEYISSKNWIELEYEISQFHLSSVKNGFLPSMVINFSAQIPSPEEMDNVIRRLKKEYEGASNGGKVIFTFSDGQQNAPIITPINPNNSDERFIQLNREVTEGIMAGHRVINPSLFGIKTEGELGGKNTILESMDIFTAQYIKPKQRVIQSIINDVLSVNGLGEAVINKFRIETTIQPNVTEILSLLQAPISTEQKAELLKLVGYDDDSIKKLLNTNEQG